MKLRYEAFSPPDNGDRIAGGELELADDADHQATLDALRSIVEEQAVVDSGSPVRVITDTDIWYTWDHA